MGFVIIQHLDPSHRSVLSPLLGKKSAIPVTEASEGARVERAHAYVIPPDTVMTVSKGILRLATRGSDKRPMPIDHFMRSLALDAGARAIGVILSGTASDGTLGMKAIKAAGGRTFAQDQASAQYPGMPASAIASGIVDAVLPPESIAKELAALSHGPTLPPAVSPVPAESLGTPPQLARLFELLRKVTGLDFGPYKRTTIHRRIARRMTLAKVSTLDDYLEVLRKDRNEVEALTQDLLIKVTTFFRDDDAFLALQKKVFPALLKHRKREDPMRIWVPGCSTGEEVYSIGMGLVEALEDLAPGLPCQIFATDISEAAIARARAGFYTGDLKGDVSPDRLRRFFVKTAEGYRIAKSVRDLCVFAKQDLTKDPPFSKLDLISCRNVLIYMGSDLQKRIIPIFHYALKPGGFLMLGTAESTGSFANLFTLADKKGKIYAKKPATSDVRLEPHRRPPTVPLLPSVREDRPADLPPSEPDVFKEADKIILSRYSPPGVLLSLDLDILQFRGHTAPYLEHAPGRPTMNVLKLVKEDLVYELRAAAEKAAAQAIPVRTRPIELQREGQIREVTIDVVPVHSPTSPQPLLLVLFNDRPVARPAPGKEPPPGSRKAEARLVAQLRRELAAIREELQSVIEEQEAAHEEFKSANEEILSSNEELQSTNEELETAKEELQSANEELTTLNEELMTRNAELGQLNSDITNLLSSIHIPILMLSLDLRIRRFTPVAGVLLNLIPGDVGRPITDINPNIDVPNLSRLVAEVIDTMIVKEQDIRAKDGHWYSLRIRPYRTLENKIDGATVTFLDIDAVKKSQLAEAVLETVREPILVLTSSLRVVAANPPLLRLLNADRQAILHRLVYELDGGRLDVPPLRSLLEEGLLQKQDVDDLPLELDLPQLGIRSVHAKARRLKGDHEGGDLILLALEGIPDPTTP